ncbi:hypothetical protein IQ229_10495 [Nostoc cf. edaphicum LEGE 07299]|uniref:Uncharacterized protein n=1 Tax=Nostoc cf. edaphicum LEGE 07299 TaxID=2777974 RepID=A0ABR9TY55_9NOSO|nr:hypothetical protein [Nostoc edaphicum]MBE9105355.1 hypothetical protein [Nostoc cf. edaphicum LEGE 07299]
MSTEKINEEILLLRQQNAQLLQQLEALQDLYSTTLLAEQHQIGELVTDEVPQNLQLIELQSKLADNSTFVESRYQQSQTSRRINQSLASRITRLVQRYAGCDSCLRCRRKIPQNRS